MEYPPGDTPLQGTGARCAQHEDIPAAIICSRCGSYACMQCRQWGHSGQDLCANCTVFQPELAERGSRFLANLVDQMLVIGPWMVALFFGGVLAAATESEGAEAAGGLMGCMGTLLSLGLVGVQLYLVSQSGQSIGKRMVGIKVVRSDGSPCSLGRILFLRNVIPILVGFSCGFFNLADAIFIFNEDRCCLHDKMADTIVVKVDASR
jgi:uncharacterized RDD family membrane protein YckC